MTGAASGREPPHSRSDGWTVPRPLCTVSGKHSEWRREGPRRRCRGVYHGDREAFEGGAAAAHDGNPLRLGLEKAMQCPRSPEVLVVLEQRRCAPRVRLGGQPHGPEGARCAHQQSVPQTRDAPRGRPGLGGRLRPHTHPGEHTAVFVFLSSLVF